MSEEKAHIVLNVEGMSCTNCALTVSNAIKQDGGAEIDVNFTTGEASFYLDNPNLLDSITTSIKQAGYRVGIMNDSQSHDHNSEEGTSDLEKKFYFTLFFTIPLFSHMFLPFVDLLQQPLVQLALCLPVFTIGIRYFGMSALNSIKTGTLNMDVLITMGFTAAFFYSLAGTIMLYGTPEVHNYLFYETAATIITLVLLGNVLEHRSVQQTTTAIKELSELKPQRATLVIEENGEQKTVVIEETEIEKENILLINTGDIIPADGAIIWGDASVDESMITGESTPLIKTVDEEVIGGTIVSSGSIKIRVTNTGSETVLSKIIELVKRAQQNKPEIQQLGDKVSSIFVPVVIVIAIGTFIVSHFVFDIPLTKSIMSSIAVLVISCPCAMGLATPTAIMAGIGRAAKNGILIKGGSTLEDLAKIKTIVFDKTGTLTTGKFQIGNIECLSNLDREHVIDILFSLEQHSSHPIAKSIIRTYKNSAKPINFKEISEEKGLGVRGTDEEGNAYYVGSYTVANHLTDDNSHSLYLLKNDRLIALIDIEDEIKKNANSLFHQLNNQEISTVLLSGDTNAKCVQLAQELNIKTVYSEQKPAEKLKKIEELNAIGATAMVGDGINDAPALANALVGISLGNATQVAIQSAQVILLKGDDLAVINEALQISKHTYLTIKQNLFWAFFYNVVAIPIAAMGFLNPMVGALAMAFSDVIVIGNSIRLKTKKIS